MRVWLDDLRDPKSDPASTPFWRDAVWVKTPEAAIALLATGKVQALSLDNDLGLPLDSGGRPREGYMVADWLEQHTFLSEGFTPPRVLNLHSANSVVRRKVEAAFGNIARWAQERDVRHPGQCSTCGSFVCECPGPQERSL